MKIRPTTVLLVLASVTAFTASARADTPEQHVFGMDSYAPGTPRVDLMNADRPRGRHASGRHARREGGQRQEKRRHEVRERTRSVRHHENIEHHEHAERHRGRRIIRAVAVHEDGAKVARRAALPTARPRRPTVRSSPKRAAGLAPTRPTAPRCGARAS
jgi:hypothetical protein